MCSHYFLIELKIYWTMNKEHKRTQNLLLSYLFRFRQANTCLISLLQEGKFKDALGRNISTPSQICISPQWFAFCVPNTIRKTRKKIVLEVSFCELVGWYITSNDRIYS